MLTGMCTVKQLLTNVLGLITLIVLSLIVPNHHTRAAECCESKGFEGTEAQRVNEPQRHGDTESLGSRQLCVCLLVRDSSVYISWFQRALCVRRCERRCAAGEDGARNACGQPRADLIELQT